MSLSLSDIASDIVLNRPPLLAHFIRCQYLAALDPDTRDEYTREERTIAAQLVTRYARLMDMKPQEAYEELCA